MLTQDRGESLRKIQEYGQSGAKEKHFSVKQNNVHKMRFTNPVMKKLASKHGRT